MLNCDAIPMPPQRYAVWGNIAAIALEVVASCENNREMRLENARSANRKKISELMSTWVLGDYCGCKIMQFLHFSRFPGVGAPCIWRASLIVVDDMKRYRRLRPRL